MRSYANIRIFFRIELTQKRSPIDGQTKGEMTMRIPIANARPPSKAATCGKKIVSTKNPIGDNAGTRQSSTGHPPDGASNLIE